MIALHFLLIVLLAAIAQARRITFVNRHKSSVLAKVTPGSDGDGRLHGFELKHGSEILDPGERMTFGIESPWSGSVVVTEGDQEIIGDESQAEFGLDFGKTSGRGGHAWFDVSYVTGFSLPIVCGCKRDGWVNGCNVDLRKENDGCPDDMDNGLGSCRNPRRDDRDCNKADPFFRPCEGAVYTFINAHDALNHGLCDGQDLRCCVGSKCHRSKKQGDGADHRPGDEEDEDDDWAGLDEGDEYGEEDEDDD